jgi:hypothetical protein
MDAEAIEQLKDACQEQNQVLVQENPPCHLHFFQ